MNKSPDAFRTISEVSEQLDVPAHVLRFWETRFAQVKPVKRGGGRRYYRPDDVRLLRGIRRLLYDEGMTIKGAQKILREQGVRHVIGLGTVEEPDAAAPAPLPARAPAPVRAVPAQAEAEPVLAAAGGAPPRGDGPLARGGPAPRAELPEPPVEPAGPIGAPADDAAPEIDDLPQPIARAIDRDALRRLVSQLEALRGVMAGERRA